MATSSSEPSPEELVGPEPGGTYAGAIHKWNDRAVAYEALSVRQPWAHAIAHLGKRMENRTWPFRRFASMSGTRIAIHASGKVDTDACAELRRRGHVLPDHLKTSAIIAVAFVDQVLRAKHARACYPEQAEWIVDGGICLVLDDVIALPEPIGAAGALGFWFMTDQSRIAVARQVREIEAARG